MNHPVQLATSRWPPAGTDAGAVAPVAVLVHGIVGWHRTWWRVGPALARRGWHVIAVDQRGHGRSPPIDGTATVAELAEDLGAAIDRVGPVPVDLLIGHSLGASVAGELAHRRPEIARRLVLEDPPGITRTDDLEFQERLEREVLAARTTPEAEVARALAEKPTWLEEDARQDVEGRALSDLEGVLASLRHGLGARVVELAPRLSIPTLYLLAREDDSPMPREPRSRLRAGLPPTSHVVEMDSGHVIHRDRFEAYLATILGWLADD